MDTDAEGTAAPPSPPKKRRRNGWAPGIPRRRRKAGDPWQIQVLRGLLPLVVVVGFLGLGMVLAVLAYNAIGSEMFSVVAAGSGLVLAALFTQRVVSRMLEFFS
ncbi:MAG: hypothetical protein Q7U96_02955 [Chloroflexota bacterium]|nr:hypothetical protein [Chloroflexota bacterium]